MSNYEPINNYSYTPHHKPSPPSSSGPTMYYLAVSSSSSSSLSLSTITVMSATTAIVHIMGLVVAWCCLPPLSSSSLSSTATATPPTMASPPPRPRSPPPLQSPPQSPSCPLRPLDRPWRHLGPACGLGALQDDAVSATPARTPLVGIWAHCASAPITAAAMPRSPLRRPALDPPLLLRSPPPIGRRQWQHGDVDGCASATMTPDLPGNTRCPLGLLECGMWVVGCVFGMFSWSVLWLSFVGCVLVPYLLLSVCGNARPHAQQCPSHELCIYGVYLMLASFTE